MARSPLKPRRLIGILALGIVLTILGKVFLGSISVPRSAITRSTIEETRYRIYLFAAKNGKLPQRLSELPERDGYNNRMADLWERQLIYEVDDAGIISLVSYGRDGKLGGTSEDTDIIYRYRSHDEKGEFIVGYDGWLTTGRIKN